MNNSELEALTLELNDPSQLAAYEKPFGAYQTSLIPRILGKFLVLCGNVMYGYKPSYLKFRAIEVIARVPYQSWEAAAYTLLTLFYSNEEKAMQLSKITQFARMAQDNETMHVVVISQLAKREGKRGFLRYTLIPFIFSFLYFVAVYLLYIIKPRYALELNYLFEQHAFEQYGDFLKLHEDELRKKPVGSEYLLWYGRNVLNQYEFFQSVRNDELIHRNRSIREIELNEK